LIRSTGPQAKANPFRFSTKYTDEESDLVYYGYRYYSPSLGRWVNRDPIEEEGDVSLYSWLLNNPITGVDALGQFTFVEILMTAAEECGEKAIEAARALPIKARVRQVVKTLNAIESFKEGYDTASDMIDIGGLDMLERLETLRAEQAQGLLGPKSLSSAELHNHHIFPQKFRDTLKGIAKEKFDIDKFLIRMNKDLHLKGLHGGKYNEMWKHFLDKFGTRIKGEPMFLIGFGFGLMNELGFGNYSVIP
jgi:RHS repeat-associated protein